MRDNIFIKMYKTFIPSKKNDYHPLILRPKNLFILAVILLAVKFILFSWLFYYPRISNFAVVTSNALIELTNNERIANGLKPLRISDKLTLAAEQKARDMLINAYFAHTSPSGITPWHWLEINDYKYLAAGENLAKDFTESEYVHRAWMNSSSHRANIMNENYQEIGIAVVEGEINGKKTVLAVQFFGKPAAVKPVSTPKMPPPTTNVGIATQPPSQPVNPVNNLPSQNPELSESPQKEKVQGNEQITPEETTLPVSEYRVTENEVILNDITKNSELFLQKIYFIITGLLGAVLLLTVFVNVRSRHPKLIFGVIVILVIIGAIASFNGQSLLNRGIDLLDGASIQKII